METLKETDKKKDGHDMDSFLTLSTNNVECFSVSFPFFGGVLIVMHNIKKAKLVNVTSRLSGAIPLGSCVPPYEEKVFAFLIEQSTLI
jgi:hypothetical protein